MVLLKAVVSVQHITNSKKYFVSERGSSFLKHWDIKTKIEIGYNFNDPEGINIIKGLLNKLNGILLK